MNVISAVHRQCSTKTCFYKPCSFRGKYFALSWHKHAAKVSINLIAPVEFVSKKWKWDLVHMCRLDSVEFNNKGNGKDCLLLVGNLQIPF